MNRAQKIAAAVSLAVLVLCLLGSILIRGVMKNVPFLHGQEADWKLISRPDEIVDQRPWSTAKTLTAWAGSAEELQLAQEAGQLADHEVDQNFAQSLRQAGAETRELTAEALTLQQRVTELQHTVEREQERIVALKGEAADHVEGAVPASPSSAKQEGDDLEAAKAQLSLDQDELSDSRGELARASGDHREEIQRELSAREAETKKYDLQATGGEKQAAVFSTGRHTTLAGQTLAWWAQRSREQLIEQAEQLARADAAALTADHARIQHQAETSEANAAAKKVEESSTARVKELQGLATQRTILSIVEDRLSTQQQLAALYVRWANQIELQHKIMLRLMLRSLALIAIIVLLTILASWALQMAFVRMSRDGRERQTLRIVLNRATEAIGLLLVLVVIFGPPRQMATILGVATAGLILVFRDFILALCGCLVLRGRNGIRAGDRVQIEEVRGEAVEIGLFRTWLLETGNGTTNGHPTGRLVSFLNGYAIRGKYFNFSTAGQWIWDEIKVSIPPGVSAYSLIDLIHEAVARATESDAMMAEEAWRRATHKKGLPYLSATPSVDIRPTSEGVDIVVRYVTRAAERLETNNRMFETVVELMHGAWELSRK
jgi:small-conductance mechanosensitive channel